MYAKNTEVPVEKSKAEIESILIRHGAKTFQSGWSEESSMIAFRLNDYTIRFVLPHPKKESFRSKFDKRLRRNVKNTDNVVEKLYDQECRRRWRALKIVVQAKLEAVEINISTLVEEFMAFIVIPSGETFGHWVISNALPAIREGRMPVLSLPAGPPVVSDNS